MTRRHPAAEELLREMRSSVLPVDSPEAKQNRRDRTISHLLTVQTKELGRKGARVWRRTAVVATVLAALATGFAFYVGTRDHRVSERTMPPLAQTTTVRALEGRVTVIHGGKETQHGLGVGMPLEAGDAVRTTESRAAMTMPSRATVEVSSSTNLSLGAPERPRAEWLDLELGRVDVEVPKLDPGRSLSVRTPHAMVTVHGTRFSVIVAPGAGGALQTTVDVREGAVQVEHDGRTTEVASGSVWSSESAATMSPESFARREPEVGAAAADTTPRADSPSHGTGSSGRDSHAAGAAETAQPPSTVEFAPPATSTLAAENALMQRAMVASRNGDDRRAIAILDTLISRFPHSILKENAQVERLRALERLGHAAEVIEP